MVELHLLNLWWLEIHNMVRWVILPIPNIMPGLCLEACNPECLVRTLKNGTRSVMIRAAISSNLVVLYLTLNGRITASDCVDIWSSQVHPMVQCFFLTVLQFFKIMIDHTHSQKCSVLVWGAWRCTLTSLASTIAHLKYCQTTVVSFRERGEKQIPSIISQAARRVVQYCTRDYSVYSKKDTSCVTGKWWPNSILIKKCVSFTAVSITFVHPQYMLPS